VTSSSSLHFSCFPQNSSFLLLPDLPLAARLRLLHLSRVPKLVVRLLSKG
jgi:hypothetical protein